MSKAESLQPKTIKRVLRSCGAMQHGQAKACSIALSHAALRVTEIALLDVKTVLLPSGAIREEVHRGLENLISDLIDPHTNPNSRFRLASSMGESSEPPNNQKRKISSSGSTGIH